MSNSGARKPALHCFNGRRAVYRAGTRRNLGTSLRMVPLLLSRQSVNAMNTSSEPEQRRTVDTLL